MRKTMLTAAAAAAILTSVGATAADAAITFDSINDSGTVYFDGYDGGPVIAGLTSSVTYKLTNISGNNWTFAYTINNTSGGQITGSRVSMIGFDVSPDVKQGYYGTPGVDALTGVFDSEAQNGNVPNFAIDPDVCLSGSTCAGGGNEGVTLGHSGSGTFVLHFNSWPAVNAVSFDDFVVRYQSIGGVRGLSSATGSEIVPPTTGAVPEPATWAVMLMGIFGLGALLRRRKALAVASI